MRWISPSVFACVVMVACSRNETPDTTTTSSSTKATPSSSQASLTPLADTPPSSVAPPSDTPLTHPKPATTLPLTLPSASGSGAAVVGPVHIKPCCDAIRKNASMVAAAQAGALLQAAGVCDGLAATMATAPNLPVDLGPLKQMLAGQSLPPVCQGLK